MSVITVGADVTDITVGLLAIGSNLIVNSFPMRYNVTDVRIKYNMTDAEHFFQRFNYYFKYTKLWASFRNSTRHNGHFIIPDIIEVNPQSDDILCIKGLFVM